MHERGLGVRRELHSVASDPSACFGEGGGGGRLRALRRRFDATRTFLFKGLLSFTKRGSTAAGSGLAQARHMQSLLVRLDFNGFYSRRR